MFFRFAVFASVGKKVVSVKFNSSVKKRLNKNFVAVFSNGSNTVNAALYLLNVKHTLAGNADGINLFAVEAMFCKKLVKAVCIAGFEENKNLSVPLFPFLLRDI